MLSALMKEAPPRWYLAHCFRHLISSADSKGKIAVFDFIAVKGYEPPLHVHKHEDEAFFILDGAIRFFVGNRVVDGAYGDYIQLPRGLPHRFEVLSPTARFLMILTPAPFENFFLENSIESDRMEPRDFSKADFKLEPLVSRAERYEVTVISG